MSVFSEKKQEKENSIKHQQKQENVLQPRKTLNRKINEPITETM